MFSFKKIFDDNSHNNKVVVIDRSINTKSELFSFFNKELNFPNYFGHNWDALDECLADYDYEKISKLVLYHEDLPLLSINDLKIYIQTLRDLEDEIGHDKIEILFNPQKRLEIERTLKSI